LGCKAGQGPRAQRGIYRVGVELLQDPPDGRLVRGDRADLQLVEDVAAGVVGVLGDRGIRAGTGEHRGDVGVAEDHLGVTGGDPEVLEQGRGGASQVV
jgi:hypothetical protein